MRIAPCKRHFITVCLVFAAIAWLGRGALAQNHDTFSLALTHVTVIDGTGAAPRPNQTVLLSADRIVTVGPSTKVRIPNGTRTIDGGRRFLIPGLWDAHVHTRYAGIDHLRLFIATGITSVRNMSAPWEHLAEVREWRRDIEAGRRIGPRLLTAGPVFDGPGTVRQTNLTINNAEEARDAVRRARRAGADFIKVYNLLSPESFTAIAAEANAQGLPFVGHVPLVIDTSAAVAAGQHTLEHIEVVALGASDRETELRKKAAGWRPSPAVRAGPFDVREIVDSFSPEKLRSLAALLGRMGAALVPTLVSARNRFDPPIPPAGAQYVPAAYLDVWKQAPPSGSTAADRLLYEHVEKLLRGLDAEGVTILAGTDGGTPFQVSGFSLHEELSLLVKAGLSEMKALQAATRDPARVFHLPAQGTIEPGKRADLVLLDANPLENIANTRKIRLVVAAGRVFDRSDLDAMLADIQKNAREWTGTPTR